jgi:hypothetical protein
MRAPRRMTLGLVAVVLAALALVACGIDPQDEPTVADREKVPEELLERPSTTADATTIVPVPTTIYLVRGDQLVGVQRLMPSPVSATGRLTALARGPDEMESALGLGTAVPSRDLIGNVREGGGVVQVELTTRLDDLTPLAARLCIAQIVLTAVGDDPAAQVSFIVDGEALAVPLPDGSMTTTPVDRTTYDELIAAA